MTRLALVAPTGQEQKFKATHVDIDMFNIVAAKTTQAKAMLNVLRCCLDSSEGALSEDNVLDSLWGISEMLESAITGMNSMIGGPTA